MQAASTCLTILSALPQHNAQGCRTTFCLGYADLARRLRAAADGADYQGGLSDDDDDEDEDNHDAEISELEEELEPNPHAASEAERQQASPDQEQEEGLDVMHSPVGQPWGAEVRTLLLSCFVACLLQQH